MYVCVCVCVCACVCCVAGDPQHAPLVSFFSGAVAGAAATLASYPFDLLRTTLAAQGEPQVKGVGGESAGSHR